MCRVASIYVVLNFPVMYRYDSPFLEIVGVTSTWKNFNVAGAFLAHEETDNYTWAIEQLAKLFFKVKRQPTCVVTDREAALMKPVYSMFPNVKFLLCRLHVQRNIELFARKLTDKARATRVANAYRDLFYCTTEEDYNVKRYKLFHNWRDLPKLHYYAHQTWFKPHKEKLVAAWTDDAFTLGQNTTNR